ncbi:MAG: hypothetical protein NT099_06445 [Candidatus Saganbacteria bacterium]|nr:hypothetical protein [Candidatus Saganbacteria bacterium]
MIKLGEYFFSVFAVPFGVMGVVCSPDGLHMIILPRKSAPLG